jgi:hypothetical protein
MKIVSFISPAQRHVIEKILTHCGLCHSSGYEVHRSSAKLVHPDRPVTAG